MSMDSLWSPGERKLLEEGIIPSPHSVELERTALSDYMQRLAGPRHIAELFHENSKLTPSSTLTVPLDGRKLAEVREWYFSTAYAMRESEVEPKEEHQFRCRLRDLPEPLRPLLRPFTQAGAFSDLLYGVDLLLLHGGSLLRTIARSEVLWVERRVRGEEIAELQAALLDLSDYEVAHATALLFVVGCPWRYMMVYGPRGYRHTLLDAGRLLAGLEEIGHRHHLRLATAQNFYDAKIDHFLYADGVERSALAVVAVAGGPA